jgi:hypothetical protein
VLARLSVYAVAGVAASFLFVAGSAVYSLVSTSVPQAIQAPDRQTVVTPGLSEIVFPPAELDDAPPAIEIMWPQQLFTPGPVASIDRVLSASLASRLPPSPDPAELASQAMVDFKTVQIESAVVLPNYRVLSAAVASKARISKFNTGKKKRTGNTAVARKRKPASPVVTAAPKQQPGINPAYRIGIPYGYSAGSPFPTAAAPASQPQISTEKRCRWSDYSIWNGRQWIPKRAWSCY